MTDKIPVAGTLIEGGPWLAWNEIRGRPLHAIRFEDGSIFDTFNGWRTSRELPAE